jgi:hypothetical protein
MPFPIFGCPSRWRTVFNPSTRVSNFGHSGKETVSRSGSKLRSALGFGSQWLPCNVAPRMLSA